MGDPAGFGIGEAVKQARLPSATPSAAISGAHYAKRHLISTLSLVSLSIRFLFGANPIVTGPIARKTAAGDPAHNYPFFSALEDLNTRGYVEQEYFYSGTANRYETPAGATGKVLDGNHKYKTRLPVRGRPTRRSSTGRLSSNGITLRPGTTLTSTGTRFTIT